MSDTGRWDAKDPDEKLFYSLDWTAPLAGDTIDTATWTLPAGITLRDENVTGNVTQLLVDGGVNGESYAVKCTVTTVGGQIMERTRTLKVKTK